MQDRFFLFITEGNVIQRQRRFAARQGGKCERCFRLIPLRLAEERFDPLNAGNRRLDVLNFHADVFQGRENLADIGGDRHCRTNRHAE